MQPSRSRLRAVAVATVALALLPARLALVAGKASAAHAGAGPGAPILVVGSLNVDIIIEVDRLPSRGETRTAISPSAGIAVGGKGANQAVAAARLAGGRPVRFVSRLGNDSYAAMLEAELRHAGVDLSGCGRAGEPSGQGVVLLEPDGTASSVVLAGANAAWPPELPALSHLVAGAGAVLLQREVPERVNEAVAAASAAAGVPVLQDAGGEDRRLSDALLSSIDFLCPNESELRRLTGLPTDSEDSVLAAARQLAQRGAKNVVVTLAERGSLLLRQDGSVLRQPALPVPGAGAVDATAAGDAFRAAFAVALVEGRPLQEALRFAAAAGALAVSRLGAVPSLPTRSEVEALLLEGATPEAGAGGAASASAAAGAAAGACPAPAPQPSLPPATTPEDCPYEFASRLNSMAARRDLAGADDGADDVLGWIKRQSKVKGLALVDFNFPQHLRGLTVDSVRRALAAAGLRTGAVCLRFPAEFALGAFSGPDEGLRKEAVALAAEGGRWAADLGARDLIVWSPWDGYDYFFQVDYVAAWQRTVACFQALADAVPPGVRVSLEWKPTDEATRFSIVASTGAALLLVQEVGRPNFGLTLDVGHLLLAGENPAQSLAMVGAAGRLFGLQLGDGHVRLGAEDGLAFGAANPTAALELVRWLQRTHYDGHLYFDTFPRKEDPVREAEFNVRRFRALWKRAARLAAAGLDGFAARHDALGALELLEADEAAAQGAAPA